jgi:hypothetical protein
MEDKIMKTRDSKSNKNRMFMLQSFVLLAATLFTLSANAATAKGKMKLSTAKSTVSSYLNLESEKTIHLEEWMFQDTLFNALAQAEPAVKEEKTEMVQNRKKVIGVTFEGVQFGQRSFIIIEEDDPKPTLERWMFDYSHFKK